MKRSIYNYILFVIVVYVLSITELYVYSYNYSNYKSSVCIDCSLINEIFSIGLINSILFFILYIITKILKKANVLLLEIVFVILLFLSNITIFNARVSSWSTYTNLEIFYSVGQQSILYLLVFGILFYLYLKFHYFKIR